MRAISYSHPFYPPPIAFVIPILSPVFPCLGFVLTLKPWFAEQVLRIARLDTATAAATATLTSQADAEGWLSRLCAHIISHVKGLEHADASGRAAGYESSQTSRDGLKGSSYVVSRIDPRLGPALSNLGDVLRILVSAGVGSLGIVAIPKTPVIFMVWEDCF